MLKKLLKGVLILLLIILVLLALLYATAPYWVPAQLKSLAPESLQLHKLELERPGLTSTKVNSLQLAINGDSPLNVELEQVTLHYSLLKQQLTSISAKSAKLNLDSSNGSQSEPFSNKIPLPTLPLEQLDIENLSINGLFVQSLNLRQLSLTQLKDKLSFTSDLEFLGINFSISGQAHQQQNFLQSLETTVKQQQDILQLSLSPTANQHSSFNWQLKSQLNIANYFPIPGVEQVTIDAKGKLAKGNENKKQLTKTEDKNSDPLNITFQQNSLLSAPIRLDQWLSKDQLQQQLAQLNLQLDLKDLSEELHVSLAFEQDTNFQLQTSEQMNLLLKSGSLPLSIKHPSFKLQSQLERLELFPNLSLTDPQQSLAGKIGLELTLHKLLQQTDTLHVQFNQLATQLAGQFELNSGLFSLMTSKLSSQLSPLKLKQAPLTLTTSASKWQGQLSWQAQLSEPFSIKQQSLNIQSVNPLSANMLLNSKNGEGEQVKIKDLFSQLHYNGQQLNTLYQIGEVNLSQQPLRFNQLKGSANFQPAKQKATGQLSFKQLNYQSEQVALNDFSGQLKWSLAKQKFNTHGKLTKQGSQFPFNYSFNLARERHKIELVPVALSANMLAEWLSPILGQYPELSIKQGKLTSPRVAGDPLQLTFNGKLNLRNLDLSYDNLNLINLQIEDTLNGKSSLSGAINGRIEKIEVASGIIIDSVRFYMQHNLQQIVIQDLLGNLLDGNLYISEMQLTPDAIAPFTLALKHINLGKLLTLLESESMAIEGHFDLNLPIVIKEQGQQIVEGTFTNIGPGRLAIQTSDAQQSNIAFQALQNFHYQHFSGVINYDAAGIYHLQILLKGNNPDLYDGFPIELKMNIEGNLPNLLYSMLISGDIAKPIIKKYQSGDLHIKQAQ